jgi:uncharacterized protein
MRLNLIPRDEKFQDMFSKASKNVVEAAKTFKEAIGEWKLNKEKVNKIHDLEREGDLIRHELIDKLNHTFITPIDREDIYDLSGELDDIVDMIQASIDRMQIYDLDFSGNEGLLHLAEVVEKSSILLDNAINDMHDNKKKRRVLDQCIEINQLENEGDNLIRKLLRSLFEDRKAMSSLDIMLWKEIFEFVESIIDKCEDVACTIESIVVKNY